jgi:hypothetical protein
MVKPYILSGSGRFLKIRSMGRQEIPALQSYNTNKRINFVRNYANE